MRIWVGMLFAVAGCASIAELGEFTDEASPVPPGGTGGAGMGGGGTSQTSATSSIGGATSVGGAGGGGGSSSTAMAMCPAGSTPGTTMGTCMQSFEVDVASSGMLQVSDSTCPPSAGPQLSKPTTIHVIFQGGGTSSSERDGFLSFDVDLPVPQNQIISGTLRLTPDTIFNANLPPGIEVQAFGGTQPLFGELAEDDFAVAGTFLDGMSASQALAAGEATLQIPGEQIQLGGVATQLRLTLNATCPYPQIQYEFDYIMTAIPPVLDVLFLP